MDSNSLLPQTVLHQISFPVFPCVLRQEFLLDRSIDRYEIANSGILVWCLLLKTATLCCRMASSVSSYQESMKSPFSNICQHLLLSNLLIFCQTSRLKQYSISVLIEHLIMLFCHLWIAYLSHYSSSRFLIFSIWFSFWSLNIGMLTKMLILREMSML